MLRAIRAVVLAAFLYIISRDKDICRLYLSEKEDEDKTVETVANDVEDGRDTINAVCPELSHE